MNGTPQNEFDKYRCNIFNDVSNDGTLKRTFSSFMNERWNEEGNGEKELEWGDNENEGKISCILSKGRSIYKGAECELMDDVGLFITSGHVKLVTQGRQFLIISLVRIMSMWVFCIAQIIFQRLW